MARQEQQHHPHVALHALVGIDCAEHIARLDHVQDLGVDVAAHHAHVLAALDLGLRRPERRVGLRHEQRAQVGIGLQQAQHRLVGLVRVLVGGGAAGQLHAGVPGLHASDEGRDAPVVVVLARVLEHRVLALAAHRGGDRVGRLFALALVVRGHEGDPLRVGRIRREGHHRDAHRRGTVDGLNERVRIHRVQQDAGRLARQFLLEGRQLLVDVVLGRAGVARLHAQRAARLFHHFVDREPVLHARDHHVHHVGVAGVAAQAGRSLGGGLALREGLTGGKARCRDGGSLEEVASHLVSCLRRHGACPWFRSQRCYDIYTIYAARYPLHIGKILLRKR